MTRHYMCECTDGPKCGNYEIPVGKQLIEAYNAQDVIGAVSSFYCADCFFKKPRPGCIVMDMTNEYVMFVAQDWGHQLVWDANFGRFIRTCRGRIVDDSPNTEEIINDFEEREEEEGDEEDEEFPLDEDQVPF